MDPNNPIVKLCAQGMEEESNEKPVEAAKLFAQAWTQTSNDFERCIAAHYLARHQPNATFALHWNQEALDCAKRVSDGSAAEFFPSLYLNLGKSHEDLGDAEQARQLYQCAANCLGAIPAGPYRDMIKDGVDRGLQRVADSVKSL